MTSKVAQIMRETPQAIRLLTKLWDTDERFVPEGVREWPNPGGFREWQWSGGTDQSGGDVHLDLFHNWTQIDQQALVEAAVGKIFSVLSMCILTVVQIDGKVVSVKHREFQEVRRFKSQKTMVANLFNAVIKMVEVGWLPSIKAKDGHTYYTQEQVEQADHLYELKVMKDAMYLLNKKLQKEPKESVLPPGDPFSDVPMFMQGGNTAQLTAMRSELASLKRAIADKEDKITSLYAGGLDA